MEEGALNVQAPPGGAVQHPCHHKVKQQSSRTHSQHQKTLDLWRVREAPVRLKEDPTSDEPQAQCVEQGRQNLSTVEPKRMFDGRRPPGYPHGKEGQTHGSSVS